MSTPVINLSLKDVEGFYAQLKTKPVSSLKSKDRFLKMLFLSEESALLLHTLCNVFPALFAPTLSYEEFRQKVTNHILNLQSAEIDKLLQDTLVRIDAIRAN